MGMEELLERPGIAEADAGGQLALAGRGRRTGAGRGRTVGRCVIGDAGNGNGLRHESRDGDVGRSPVAGAIQQVTYKNECGPGPALSIPAGRELGFCGNGTS